MPIQYHTVILCLGWIFDFMLGERQSKKKNTFNFDTGCKFNYLYYFQEQYEVVKTNMYERYAIAVNFRFLIVCHFLTATRSSVYEIQYCPFSHYLMGVLFLFSQVFIACVHLILLFDTLVPQILSLIAALYKTRT